MNQKCNQHLRRAHDLVQMQQSFGVGPIRQEDRYWMNSMTPKHRRVKKMQLFINCSEAAALKHISPRKLTNALYGANHKDGLTDLLNKELQKKFKSWAWVDVEYTWQEDAPLSKPTTAKLKVEFSIAHGDYNNYNRLHKLRKESDRYYPDPEELQLIHDTVQECFNSLPQSVSELSFLSPIQLTDVTDKTKYHSHALIQKAINEQYDDLNERVQEGDRTAGTRRRRFHKRYR